MYRGHRHFITGWRYFWRQLWKVARNPIFLVLTVIGNAVVFFSATAFYFLERGINGNVQSYGDALWFAFSTISTVGYGDIVPNTGAGRFIAAFLMLTGGVLFFSFIALLSNAFAEIEFLEIENEVIRLRRKLDRALADNKTDD